MGLEGLLDRIRPEGQPLIERPVQGGLFAQGDDFVELDVLGDGVRDEGAGLVVGLLHRDIVIRFMALLMRHDPVPADLESRIIAFGDGFAREAQHLHRQGGGGFLAGGAGVSLE